MEVDLVRWQNSCKMRAVFYRLFGHDGWANGRSGLGTAASTSAHTAFRASHQRLSIDEIDAMRRGSSLPKRISGAYAGDALRGGIHIDDVDEGALNSAVEDYKLLALLSNAVDWDKAYGGALIVASTEDGADLEEPVVGDGQATSFLVFEAPAATPVTDGTYGQRLNPPMYDVRGLGRVDASRCYALRSWELTAREALDDAGTVPGWGVSIYEPLYSSLAAVGEGRGNVRELLHKLSIVGVKIDGMAAILAGEDGDAKMRRIATSLNECMSILGLLVVDSSDDLVEVNRNGAEAVTLANFAYESLEMDAAMPREILRGLTSGGLNSGENKGAFQIWYDAISTYRQRYLGPAAAWCLQRMPIGLPERFEVKFGALHENEPLEEAQEYETTARADAAMVSALVVTPEEVRDRRLIEGQRGRLRE